MKRCWLASLLALMAGGIVFTVVYRRVAAGPADELAWLREEFSLDDQQFAAIAALHRSYRPVCDQHCADYQDAYAQFFARLDSQSQWTPALDEALRRVFEVERACREDMLRHAFAVSAVMTPEQGRRYLALVHERALVLDPQKLVRATRQ